MSSIISLSKRVLLPLLLALTLNTTSANAGVGEPILQSADRSLFKFFGVEKGDTTLLQESRLVLRPETPYLSEVTQLRVRLDDGGKLQRMELWMDKEFMELEWVRAYDVALFFVDAAVIPADMDIMKQFRTELEYPQDKEVIYKMPVPEMPEQSSRAYMAFRGDVRSFEQKLTNSTLRIENTEVGGKAWVRMIIVDDDAPVLSSLGKGARYKI